LVGLTVPIHKTQHLWLALIQIKAEDSFAKKAEGFFY